MIIIIDVSDSAGKEGQHMSFRFYYYLIITTMFFEESVCLLLYVYAFHMCDWTIVNIMCKHEVY